MSDDKKKIKDSSILAMKVEAKSHKEMIRIMASKTNNKFVESVPMGDPVYAMIDFGRWVACCECGGAELIDPSSNEFYCFSCGNKSNNGKTRPVIFPDNRVEIEDEILSRADERWQCWNKDQTLEELKKEKIEHGL